MNHQPLHLHAVSALGTVWKARRHTPQEVDPTGGATLVRLAFVVPKLRPLDRSRVLGLTVKIMQAV